MREANRTGGVAFSICDNIISIDGASKGIYSSGNANPNIHGNTIFSGGGTGKGIELISGALSGTNVFNNYVEGFSGTGGVGYSYNTASIGMGVRGFNAAYNNTTNLTDTNETISVLGTDPEVLSASGIAKSGSDTFANRLTYFAPADQDGMQDGAMQPGGEAG